MAAYAALISLMHTIHQIQHHPRPPISLHKTQVESLTEKITFLQESLEGYSHVGYSNEADALEMRIADAAYAAEDAIESHIADQIHPRSTTLVEKIRSFNFIRGLQKVKISSVDLYEGLQKVIQEMDLIKIKAIEITEKTVQQNVMHRKSTCASSGRSSSSRRQKITVGLDDVVIRIMDKLTDAQLDRQIIAIVGMGGSGKTTLAKNVYQNQVVVQRFDVLVWVTISHEYRVRELLLEFLPKEKRKSLIEKSECVLGEEVHKRLWGRRYLIVLDDIWDIEAWEQLKVFFPNNNNGSRIMLTTRLSNLASEVYASNVINVGFLDEKNSWDLFCEIVFGEEGCPCDLEEIGKKIVKNCKGLPLAIVVVGGLLAKTEHRREYWEGIEGNLSSVVNSEDDERCLKILHMSYMHLPVYLKPCFLYMGLFAEDERIRTSSLVKLWVAEGFVKPIKGESLEIVAKEYLKDLIDRNLVLVHQLGSMGSIKYCKIHDLLRDLCLREAQKERFYYNVTRQESLPESINSRRRIVAFDSTSNKKDFSSNTGSLVRSLIWDSRKELPSLDSRLLRILRAYTMNANHGGKYFRRNMHNFVNSRYIAIGLLHRNFKLASSIYFLWNLQTLIFVYTRPLIAPSEIWRMPQLRHIECVGGLILRDPPSRRKDDIVLVNLRKLTRVMRFELGEATVKRIPNIERLKLEYWIYEDDPNVYYFYNLKRLHKLESFHCTLHCDSLLNSSLQEFSFPHSLKKLHFDLELSLDWEDIMKKIGSLPLLEKLKLTGGSFRGHKWETVEGRFRSLKFLRIWGCGNLRYWTTDHTHFPRLEHLVLSNLKYLKEIPSDIGEIPTLQSIKVIRCSDGAVISGREILREQEELGNEELQVKVSLDRKMNEALMSLESSPNFEIIILSY